MEQIQCQAGLVNLEQILAKLSELNLCCDEMSECCDTLESGEVIRAILVGKIVYMTNDGTAPVQVARQPGDPIETYMNGGEEMKTIIFNRVQLDEMYMMGEIVYRRALELELPQYTTTINLNQFIVDNNPDGYDVIIVTNNLIQPGLISGTFVGLEVTLINNGEFQGISSGGDGMIITSPMKLLGPGITRGAGGDGGAGAGATAGSGSGGLWTTRHHTAPNCVTNGVITPRYWNEGGNMEWRPKTGTQCASTTKGPYTTAANYDHRGANGGWWSQSPWGDQGKCVFKDEYVGSTLYRWRWRNGQSSGGAAGSIDYQVYGSWEITGGRAGHSGAGRGFRVAQDAGWSAGLDASFSGDYGVFNLSNGKTIVASAASLIGYDGGHGGDWAEAGGPGENGSSGKSAGRGFVGSSLLHPDSVALVQGTNVIGAIIP